MTEESRNAGLNLRDPECHRRGQFPVVNVGVTHGNGTGAPVNRSNRGVTDLVDRLLENSDVKRLADFASCWFFVHLLPIDCADFNAS